MDVFFFFCHSTWSKGVGGRVWPELSSTLLPGFHHSAHRGDVSFGACRIAAHLRQQWVDDTWYMHDDGVFKLMEIWTKLNTIIIMI